MFTSVLIGLVGGYLASRFISRRGGGCHGGRWRGQWGGPGRGGFGLHPRRVWWLMQELHLDQQQRAQVKDVFLSARHAWSAQRFGRFELLHSLFDAMKEDKFDRAKIDAAAAANAEAETRSRREVLDKIELLYSGLTSDQKAKLHQFLAGLGEPPHGPGPDGGPYRTTL